MSRMVVPHPSQYFSIFRVTFGPSSVGRLRNGAIAAPFVRIRIADRHRGVEATVSAFAENSASRLETIPVDSELPDL